jgi:hypothetical protein
MFGGVIGILISGWFWPVALTTDTPIIIHTKPKEKLILPILVGCGMAIPSSSQNNSLRMEFHLQAKQLP